MLEVGRVEAPNGNQSHWLSWKYGLHFFVGLASACSLLYEYVH